MESLGILPARRLALARAGLFAPDRTAASGAGRGRDESAQGRDESAPGRGRAARGRGESARGAALAVIRRFGYLQLDTISIAGARSHAIVLLSRLPRLHAGLPEELLGPGTPLFEYWGHEACWMPLELYPYFEFRRKEFRAHPWWGDLVGSHPEVAKRILDRVRDDGPLKTGDLEGERGKGFWQLGIGKRVADALWSSGELAIRERKNFQRTYDLTERVIPDDVRGRGVPEDEALRFLLLRAIEGHGWATTGTLARTWRLRNRKPKLDAALASLREEGKIVPCALVDDENRRVAGWIRPADLDLAATLTRLRPAGDRGVLLSPFDPVLWDRERVSKLFGFDAVLEIYKPAPQRTYGYYCLPVLAGDRFVARLDLKADRAKGRLHVVGAHFEQSRRPGARTEARAAAKSALTRWADTLRLSSDGWPTRRRTKSSARTTVPTS